MLKNGEEMVETSETSKFEIVVSCFQQASFVRDFYRDYLGGHIRRI